MKNDLRANARERFGRMMRETLEDRIAHTELTREDLRHLTEEQKILCALDGKYAEGISVSSSADDR